MHYSSEYASMALRMRMYKGEIMAVNALAQVSSDLIKKVEKLGSKNALVQDEVAKTMLAASKYKATRGLERLGLVCEYWDKLTPELAYQWIGPAEFEEEVAEREEKRADTWNVWRNRLSIVPLLFTWFALGIAAFDYQTDLGRYPTDLNKPLLLLWEGGFHGSTPLTFTNAAILDAIFLGLILAFTIIAQRIEGQAGDTARAFGTEMRSTTDKVVKLIAAQGAIRVDPQADANTVAQAMQRVIDRALEQSKLITETAEQAVKDTHKQTSELFTAQLTPMMTQFQVDMKKLTSALVDYQTRLVELTTAASSLSIAAGSLAGNADKYTNVGQNISQHMGQLQSTQANLVTEIQKVTGDIGVAADSASTVAKEITTHMKADVGRMTQQVERAEGALRNTALELQRTSEALADAAETLAAVDLAGGGVLGWMIRRRRGGKRKHRQTNP